MRPKYIKVRARSENEGSGTAAWSPRTPVPPCFLVDDEEDDEEEDTVVLSASLTGCDTQQAYGVGEALALAILRYQTSGI
jgi:hypothetical protein